MLEVIALIPWLLVAAFWLFVIWAVVTLLGVLRQMLFELRGIGDSLRAISGRDNPGRSEV